MSKNAPNFLMYKSTIYLSIYIHVFAVQLRVGFICLFSMYVNVAIYLDVFMLIINVKLYFWLFESLRYISIA